MLKKFNVLLVVICTLIIFTYCSSKESPQYTETDCSSKESPKYTETELFNLATNIQNGGYISKYLGNYLYMNTEDHNALYMFDCESNKEIKISGDHYFCEMNIFDNSLYYISSSPGAVYKISLDDFSKDLVLDEPVGNLIVYGGYLYYRLSDDNNWGKLYRADMGGENKKLLVDNVKSFSICNDVIYYSSVIDVPKLCCISTDGTNNRTINDSYVTNIVAENEYLVYSDHKRDDRLFVYYFATDEEKCVSDDKCWDITSNGSWIFYRNQGDDGKLYCVSFDGKEKRKLTDESITDPIVLDNVLFYKSFSTGKIGFCMLDEL